MRDDDDDGDDTLLSSTVGQNSSRLSVPIVSSIINSALGAKMALAANAAAGLPAVAASTVSYSVSPSPADNHSLTDDDGVVVTSSASSIALADDGVPGHLFGDYIEMAYLGVVILVGTAINVHVLVRLLRERRRLRSSSSAASSSATGFLLLKINLNLSDLLILSIHAFGKLIWLAEYEWRFGEALCRLFNFSSMFTLYLSSNIIVCIAMDRLRTVLQARKLAVARKQQSLIRMMLTMAWILALLWSLPQLYFWRTLDVFPEHPGGWIQCSDIWSIERYELSRNSNYVPLKSIFITDFVQNLYDLTHLCFVFYGPLMVLFICYLFIATRLMRIAKSAAATKAANATANGRQISIAPPPAVTPAQPTTTAGSFDSLLSNHQPNARHENKTPRHQTENGRCFKRKESAESKVLNNVVDRRMSCFHSAPVERSEATRCLNYRSNSIVGASAIPISSLTKTHIRPNHRSLYLTKHSAKRVNSNGAATKRQSNPSAALPPNGCTVTFLRTACDDDADSLLTHRDSHPREDLDDVDHHQQQQQQLFYRNSMSTSQNGTEGGAASVKDYSCSTSVSGTSEYSIVVTAKCDNDNGRSLFLRKINRDGALQRIFLSFRTRLLRQNASALLNTNTATNAHLAPDHQKISIGDRSSAASSSSPASTAYRRAPDALASTPTPAAYLKSSGCCFYDMEQGYNNNNNKAEETNHFNETTDDQPEMERTPLTLISTSFRKFRRKSEKPSGSHQAYHRRRSSAYQYYLQQHQHQKTSWHHFCYTGLCWLCCGATAAASSATHSAAVAAATQMRRISAFSSTATTNTIGGAAAPTTASPSPPKLPLWRRQLKSRVFRTTLLVIAAHVLLWLPYNSYALMKYINVELYTRMNEKANVLKDLQFLITIINPFLYGFSQ